MDPRITAVFVAVSEPELPVSFFLCMSPGLQVLLIAASVGAYKQGIAK